MNIEDKEDRLLTVKQLADRVEYNERQIRYLMRTKGLPFYDINGIRIRFSEFLDWLEERKVQ